MAVRQQPSPVGQGQPAAPSRSRRKRRVGFWIAAALATLLAVDALQQPRRQILGRAAVGMIDVYQAIGRPITRRLVVCRFHPSCSDYARQAFLKYGFWPGLGKSSWRLMRCNPWTPLDSVDEP